MASSYVRFDGMTWPHPDDPEGIEWWLRYRTDLTEADRMIAASYVAAYRQLVADSVRVRDSKIRRLRQAAAHRPTAAPCPQCGPGYRYGDDGCRHTPEENP